MALNTGIQSLDAGAPDLRLTGDQRPQEDNIRVKIKQIAEQSGHPESFPATDSDFAALAQLSDSPDDFPSTDYDFEVILRIAKEPIYSTPEKSKAEIYANYMAQGGRIGLKRGRVVEPGGYGGHRGGAEETAAAGRVGSQGEGPIGEEEAQGGGAQYRGGETYMAPVDVTEQYTSGPTETQEDNLTEEYKLGNITKDDLIKGVLNITGKISSKVSDLIGGAFGNLIDRIRNGAVADFLDFHLMTYHWPAFNLADSFVFIGVMILIFEDLIIKKK